MRRDLHSTITGWRWLDRLTLPFWAAYCKWHEWRFFRHIGRGDADRGRRVLRQAAMLHHPTNPQAQQEVNTEAVNQ